MQEIRLIEDLKTRFETLLSVRALAVESRDELFEFLLTTSENKDEFKQRFFKQVGETLIFKQDDFLQFLDLRLLDNSFTAYANKIGLGNKAKKFLKTADEVVLNFPYKDCVLQGGQSKDEEKKQEILLNEVLAKSEIDVLFNPKVLHHILRIGDFSGSLYPQHQAPQGELFDVNDTKSHLQNSTQLNSTQLNSTQLNSTQLIL